TSPSPAWIGPRTCHPAITSGPTTRCRGSYSTTICRVIRANTGTREGRGPLRSVRRRRAPDLAEALIAAAGVAVEAIPDRIFLEVVRVIVPRRVERSGGHDLGHDGAGQRVRPLERLL